jgi:hypothetical protein
MFASVAFAPSQETLFIMDYYDTPSHETLLKWYLTPASEGVEPPPNATVVNGHFNGQFALRARLSKPRILIHFICATALRSECVSVWAFSLLYLYIQSHECELQCLMFR